MKKLFNNIIGFIGAFFFFMPVWIIYGLSYIVHGFSKEAARNSVEEFFDLFSK